MADTSWSRDWQPVLTLDLCCFIFLTNCERFDTVDKRMNNFKRKSKKIEKFWLLWDGGLFLKLKKLFSVYPNEKWGDDNKDKYIYRESLFWVK